MSDLDRQILHGLEIMRQVYETVKECGADGCPASIVFMALQEHGCTLGEYQKLETLLIKSGAIRKASDCLFAVPGFGS